MHCKPVAIMIALGFRLVVRLGEWVRYKECVQHQSHPNHRCNRGWGGKKASRETTCLIRPNGRRRGVHFVVQSLVDDWSVFYADIAFLVNPGESVLAPVFFDRFLALSLKRLSVVLRKEAVNINMGLNRNRLFLRIRLHVSGNLHGRAHREIPCDFQHQWWWRARSPANSAAPVSPPDPSSRFGI